jgi:hypothetical protein
MIYNNLSIKYVIEGLYRDFGSQEELDIWDIVEWAGEALDLIGASQQYNNEITDIPIQHYIGKLPCGFRALQQISYKGEPMMPSSGTMMPGGSDNEQEQGFIDGKKVSKANFPNFTDTITTAYGHQYYIENGKIFCSFDKGCITMAYTSIPLDDDGFPMVPDEPHYIRAIKEFCQTMMDRRAWRAGRIPEQIYRDTESKWQSFKKQARTNANMPDLGTMESIKNSWVRLKPRMNEFDNFFGTLGQREQRKLK